MPRIDTELADVIVDETIEVGEGGAGSAGADGSAPDEADGAVLTASAYFADQETIEWGITLADLTPLSCRWPSGNPRDLTTFRYCGEAAPCGPYCERHAHLAYLRRAA